MGYQSATGAYCLVWLVSWGWLAGASELAEGVGSVTQDTNMNQPQIHAAVQVVVMIISWLLDVVSCNQMVSDPKYFQCLV